MYPCSMLADQVSTSVRVLLVRQWGICLVQLLHLVHVHWCLDDDWLCSVIVCEGVLKRVKLINDCNCWLHGIGGGVPVLFCELFSGEVVLV